MRPVYWWTMLIFGVFAAPMHLLALLTDRGHWFSLPLLVFHVVVVFVAANVLLNREKTR